MRISSEPSESYQAVLQLKKDQAKGLLYLQGDTFRIFNTSVNSIPHTIAYKDVLESMLNLDRGTMEAIKIQFSRFIDESSDPVNGIEICKKFLNIIVQLSAQFHAFLDAYCLTNNIASHLDKDSTNSPNGLRKPIEDEFLLTLGSNGIGEFIKLSNIYLKHLKTVHDHMVVHNTIHHESVMTKVKSLISGLFKK